MLFLVYSLWSWHRFSGFTADVVPKFCRDLFFFFSHFCYFSIKCTGTESGVILAENAKYSLLLPLILISLFQEMASWKNEVYKRFNAWHSLPSIPPQPGPCNTLRSHKKADIGEVSPVIAIIE